jgi:tetratricopeptide (TPR) repeat protein
MMCGMTDDLYERYKEALRTGHVAVLRGSLEEALAAYQLAADIAPSRALPHTSLGGVCMRLGHLEDALTEFAAAVARSPHDEGALLGQAEALTAAGMRSEAAAALDHVAEIQEAAGRLPEAADTLRRAVELDEAPERIRRQRALLREIRFSAGDHAAEQLLARALRLRDEPAGDGPRAAAGPAFMAAPATSMPAARWSAPERSIRDTELEPEPAGAGVAAPSFPPQKTRPEPEPVAAESIAAEPEPAAPVAEPEPEPELEPVALEPEPIAEPEPVAVAAYARPSVVASSPRPSIGVMEGVDGPPLPSGPFTESEHQPTGDELLTAAEAADLAGDNTALRSLLLWTARAYAREGRFEAGLDAIHRLLQRSPSDVDAHLVLVELYVARSWDGLAAEKLRLLGRLAELNGDEETRQRLCAAATRAFPQDPTLEHLCA